jgi:hypothetical protein
VGVLCMGCEINGQTSCKDFKIVSSRSVVPKECSAVPKGSATNCSGISGYSSVIFILKVTLKKNYCYGFRRDINKTFALAGCCTAYIGSYRRFGTTYHSNLQGSRSWSINSPHFVEPEISLPRLQEPATCSYSEPDQSSPRPLVRLDILLNIILPPTHRYSM